MAWTMRSLGVLVVLAVVALAMPPTANAITADLAKKCRELSLKAYPLDHKSGTAKLREDYYRSCLAKDGKVG